MFVVSRDSKKTEQSRKEIWNQSSQAKLFQRDSTLMFRDNVKKNILVYCFNIYFESVITHRYSYRNNEIMKYFALFSTVGFDSETMLKQCFVFNNRQ